MSAQIRLRDVLAVKAALEQLAQATSHVKLSYAIAKNLAKIRPEAEALQQAAKPSEDYTKYEQARHSIATKYSGKDAEGKPLVVNGSYAIKDRKAFDEEVDKLREEYKTAIAERDAQLTEVDELLERTTDLEFHKINGALLTTEGVFKDDKADGLGIILEPLIGRVVELED